ncbi:hypothetical protein TB2_024727 [Malus domestica]
MPLYEGGVNNYPNTEIQRSARVIMSVELKKLIEANPLFSDKLQFPNIKRSRLKDFINQGLNWQHKLCKNRSPDIVIETLYVDN